jgi:hypothetical protein
MYTTVNTLFKPKFKPMYIVLITTSHTTSNS